MQSTKAFVGLWTLPGALRWYLVVLAVFGTILASPGKGFAQETYSINGSLPLSPFFVPDSWTPVMLHFRNSSQEDVNGFALIPLKSKTAPATVRVPVVVPARSSVQLVAFAYFGDAGAAARRPEAASVGVPATIIEWWSNTGQQLSRVEVLAQPVTVPPGMELTDARPGGMILSVNQRGDLDEEEGANKTSFRDYTMQLTGMPIVTPPVDDTDLPRRLIGYDATVAVFFDNVAANDLDEAQRKTLMDYVRSGGTLLLTGPIGKADPTGSWIEPYLPVHVIGQREASQIQPVGDKAIKLTATTMIAEAVEKDGQVLLRDEHYVHAAVKKVGLGQIGFISTPVNAMDRQDPRTARLWRQLLALDKPALTWDASALSARQNSVLTRMIGKSVTPWKLAAGIVGGYLLLVVGAHLALNGVRRPTAFAVTVAIAILGTIGLIVASVVRTESAELMGARLVTMDIAGGGGGMQQEAVAFIGAEDREFGIVATGPDVQIRPTVSSPPPPTIVQRPFAIPDAGVRASTVERAWRVTSSIPREVSLTAEGTFTNKGLELTFNNALGGVLESPIVLWGEKALSLEDIPQGEAQAVARDANPRGSYTNSRLFTSESAKLRGDIIRLTMLPPGDVMVVRKSRSQPMVLGWLGEEGTPKSFTLESAQSPEMRTQSLVRVPLSIRPTPVGTEIELPPAFVDLSRGNDAGLPYDPVAQEWMPSYNEAEYLVGFQPPAEMGQFRPGEVTLNISIDAPQYRVLVRRGQVSNGRQDNNLSGELLADWTNPTGGSTPAVTFQPTESDYTADGTVWVLLKVEFLEGTAPMSATPREWRLKDLSMSMRGQVVGPPAQAGIALSGN